MYFFLVGLEFMRLCGDGYCAILLPVLYLYIFILVKVSIFISKKKKKKKKAFEFKPFCPNAMPRCLLSAK